MDEDDLPTNLVQTTEIVREHYSIFVARGMDVAISYTSEKGELIVFELEESKAGLRAEETLMGIPVGDQSWDTEPDELQAIIAALANFNATSPILEEYFIGLRELWKIVGFFNGLPLPECLADALPLKKKRGFDEIEALLGNDLTFNERIIKLMMLLCDSRGNFDRVFKRYIVISDEPITTNDIDAAVLEKMKVGGKLIDSRANLRP